MTGGSGVAPSVHADDGAWNAMLADLVRRCRDAQPDELAGLADACCSTLGVRVTLYLVDHEQRRLWPMPGHGRPVRQALPIEGTTAGRAFTSVRTQHDTDRHGGTRLWVPLVDGADRLGLVEMRADRPPPDLERWQRNAETAVTLMAHLIRGKLPHGDLMHRTRRTRPMHPSAELLLAMLPPLTFGCRMVLITAVLEPCYAAGGDAYDYAVDQRIVNVTILDSMGRGMQASLTSAAVLAATRAARRDGADLADMARAADTVLTEQFGNLRFATGVLARLDTANGRLRYLNAGHPAPILIRDGRAVRTLDQGRRMPLGLPDDDIAVGEEQLQPGDCLLLYTDGVTDGRDREQPATGGRWLADAAGRSAATGLTGPELLRVLSQAVITGDGAGKADDATLLLVEWRRPR